MNINYFSDGFYFKYYVIINNKVCIKFVWQNNVFVFYKIFFLSLIRNVVFLKLIFQCIFINNF